MTEPSGSGQAASPVRRSEAEITDPEQATEYFRAALGITVHAMGMSQASPLRTSGIDTSLMGLSETTLPLAYTFRVEPAGRAVVTYRVAGYGERELAGSSDRYRPGDIYIAANADQAYGGSGGRSDSKQVPDLRTAHLDPGLLAQVAAAGPGGGPGPILFTGLDPTSPAASRLWRSTYRFVAGVLADPDVAAGSLVIGRASRLLAAVTLASFPSDAVTDPTIEDRRDAHPATVRRAVAFIEDYADQDITVADMAGAAFVSIRALQLAFRRHLATTPTTYLRRVRLDHAHGDLKRADPSRDTVTAIAMRWGFTSHSRFTRSYRAAYGVPPSQTLIRK